MKTNPFPPQFIRTAKSSLPNLSLTVTSANATKVAITITRENPPPNANFRVHAPKFPKSQTESMFVIVGSRERDEVFALKRVSWPASNSGGARGGRGGRGRGGRGGFGREGAGGATTSVSLELPPGLDGTDATVWCVSDGYVGVEAALGVRLQNSLTVPGTWVEKPEKPEKGVGEEVAGGVGEKVASGAVGGG